MFDAAWLDFTGIMSFDRLAAVKHFWDTRCAWRLAVTSLNGRFRPRKLATAISSAGGLAPFLMDALGGAVVDLHCYNDGPSTMVQLILEK